LLICSQKTCQKICLKCGKFAAKKNGKKRGKNRFRCGSCLYQWVEQRGKRINYLRAYKQWLQSRRTISEICLDLDVSYPKLIKEFDKFDAPEGLQEEILGDVAKPINLLIDATFFGREYGFLVFHDCQKVIYFKEVKTESVKDFREGIIALKRANYSIHSITIDGRRGYINNIRKLLGNIPIQMCLYHQKAIVRRYITDRPRSRCGKDLKELMQLLCKPNLQQEFIDQFYRLKDQYQYVLNQRNELGYYRNSALRSAFRSIDSNILYLFTYTDIKNSNIRNVWSHKRKDKNTSGIGQKSEEKSSEIFTEKLGTREVKKASHFFNYAVFE